MNSTQNSDQIFIQCPKCKHKNDSHAKKCQKCNKRLLPPTPKETFRKDILFGIILSIVLGLVLILLITNRFTILSVLLILVVVSLLLMVGFYFIEAIVNRNEPDFLVYMNRAEEQKQSSRPQAINDLSSAIKTIEKGNFYDVVNYYEEALRKRSDLFMELHWWEKAIEDEEKLFHLYEKHEFRSLDANLHKKSIPEKMSQVLEKADELEIDCLIGLLGKPFLQRKQHELLKKAIMKNDSPEPLLRALEDRKQVNSWNTIIEILGEKRVKEAVPVLLSILQEEKGSDRAVLAVEALGKIGDPSAVDAIFNADEVGFEEMRRTVKSALEKIDDPNAKAKLERIKSYRNFMDILPKLEKKNQLNKKKEQKVSYTLTESIDGKAISLNVETEQYCVYCKRFSDPEFHDPHFPKGGGYCGKWNGAIGFEDSCKGWEANTAIRYWLSKKYINNSDTFRDYPWYKLIDDYQIK